MKNIFRGSHTAHRSRCSNTKCEGTFIVTSEKKEKKLELGLGHMLLCWWWSSSSGGGGVVVVVVEAQALTS